MKNYKIQILDEANKDMVEIIRYIKYKLKEPEIAEQHKKVFKETIQKLRDSADIYSPIDMDFNGNSKMRKVNVKKYIVFYRIIEEKNLVEITAVLYRKSNWQGKIKMR